MVSEEVYKDLLQENQWLEEEYDSLMCSFKIISRLLWILLAAVIVTLVVTFIRLH